MQTISVNELFECLAGGPVDLIDVRTPVEFREIHADGARNIPLDVLKPTAVMEARNGQADQPLYVMCKSGMRGGKACEKFLEAGYSQVINVEGGVQAWEQAQLPVVRGKKAISLERQVRIAAGMLVLTGALLGFFVNLNFVGIAAFVGAGLIFAGVTDSCAMGMLLAKMPWNRVAACDSRPNAS